MSLDIEAVRYIVEEFFQVDTLAVEHFAEGNHHTLYLIQLDQHPDDEIPAELVARVAKSTRLPQSIESEVATINFVACHTNIPVARVHHYDSTSDNHLGAQFIIQDRIHGESLDKAIDDNDNTNPEYVLDLDSWYQLVQDYAAVVLQLFHLRFDQMGSIYQTKPKADEEDLTWVIGPSAETCVYRAGRSKLPYLDAGPWESSTDWMSGVINNEIRYLRTLPTQLKEELVADYGSEDVAWYLTDSEDRLRKLMSLSEVGSGELGPGQDCITVSKTFGLMHANLLPEHILIDMQTGQIQGITGWTDSIITPIWRMASVPYWLEWPEDPHSEWSSRNLKRQRRKAGFMIEDYLRNGVTETDVIELRKAFCSTVAMGDPENLFMTCITGSFFKRLTTLPHVLYHGVWDREVTEQCIEELEKWAAALC
ncbi:hypothetical protein FRC02_005279 [Tulasnella sp. 418]|nr:hypothetical protein FRC02_005279 [Tulasnella sp. 418]